MKVTSKNRATLIREVKTGDQVTYRGVGSFHRNEYTGVVGTVGRRVKTGFLLVMNEPRAISFDSITTWDPKP